MLYFLVRKLPEAASFLLIFFLISPSAQAQTLLRGPGSAALDPMFQDVLKKPSDVELNLAFARRAIELEDFEAGVATLERLLIGRSGLPLIRLELGMLYLRLEAPELAEAYFLQVLETPDLDDEARQRAEILLAETRAANARGSFGLSASLGIKHQSNAVARAVLEDVQEQIDLEKLFNDIPQTSVETPDSDVGVNASLGVSYSRELDGLTERRFTASLNHYGSFQQGEDSAGRGLDRLDVSVTSLRLGWNLPAQGADGTAYSIDPFFTANMVNTDTINNYSSTYTAGLIYSTQLGPRTPVSYGFDVGSKVHGQDNVADEKDAALANISMTLGRAHISGNYTSLALRASRVDAEVDYESSNGGSVTLTHSFQLLGLGLNASLGYSETTRDDIIDPEVLPIRRRDMDASASLSTGFQIFGITTSLSASYIDRDSTLPNEKYDDLAGSLTFSRSFQ